MTGTRAARPAPGARRIPGDDALTGLFPLRQGQRGEPVRDPFTFEPLAWAIRQGDPDFMNWLNNFLRQVKNDGRYDRIYNKWIKGTDWIKDIQQ